VYSTQGTKKNGKCAVKKKKDGKASKKTGVAWFAFQRDFGERKKTRRLSVSENCKRGEIKGRWGISGNPGGGRC